MIKTVNLRQLAALLLVASLSHSPATAQVYQDLQQALNDAQPGDVIEFEGTHVGNFETAAHGTAANPITVRGINGAKIKGSSTGSGYGMTIEHNYYIFEDFTVETHKKGVYGFNADHIVLRNLIVQDIGQEAVKIRRYSNYWLVENCIARDTGVSGIYGEGFYVGDASSNWESGSQPDTSGNVTFINCIAEDTANDGYDVKEGAHHVKFINCIARWPSGDPTGSTNVGNSGWYIRSNNIQLVNCSVQDLGGGYPGLKIYESTASGGPYGRDVDVKGYCADNIEGSAIHIHKSTVGNATTLYTDYTLTNVDGGLYYTSSQAVSDDPANFSQMTWSGTGGGSYSEGTACGGGTPPPDSSPSITTTSLPGASQGVSYNETLQATGGDGTLVWTVVSGSLPAGLSLSSSGTISGTPTGSGVSNFTVEVEDADSDYDSQALSINVSASGGGGGGGDLRLQDDCAETDTTANSIKADFLIHNDGTEPIALSRVTVRYWFTNDGNSDVFSHRYSQVGSNNVIGTFHGSGSTRYLQIGFTTGAGDLDDGDDTKLKVTIRDSDWDNYNQSNDYSFDGSITSFEDYDYMTVYVDGVLVWGIEP